MKAFFEEYGLVIVVTIIAVGMILFAEQFKENIESSISKQWETLMQRDNQ